MRKTEIDGCRVTGSVQAGMLDGVFPGVDILIINHAEDEVTEHTVTEDEVRAWVTFSFGEKEACEITVPRSPGSPAGMIRLISNGGSEAVTVRYGLLTHSLGAGATFMI